MIQSAGIMIVDTARKEPAVLCVQVYGRWDFPKGQLEEGESLLEAAIREVQEETTLENLVDYKLTGGMAPPTTYGTGKGKKTATYYVAERVSEKNPFLPINPELGKPENDNWSFIPVSELGFVMPARLKNIVSYLQNSYSFVQK